MIDYKNTLHARRHSDTDPDPDDYEGRQFEVFDPALVTPEVRGALVPTEHGETHRGDTNLKTIGSLAVNPGQLRAANERLLAAKVGNDRRDEGRASIADSVDLDLTHLAHYTEEQIEDGLYVLYRLQEDNEGTLTEVQLKDLKARIGLVETELQKRRVTA